MTTTKLKRLKADDIHGRLTVEVDMSKPTCVVGPNRAGKSTVLRLLSMLVAGDTKPIGATPADALIEAVFTVDGRDESHTMTIPKAGSVEHLVRGRRMATKAAIAARGDLVGQAGSWNVDDFLALSATKRTAWIAEHIQASSWTHDEVFAELQVVLDGVDDPRLDTSLSVEAREVAHADLAKRGKQVVSNHTSVNALVYGEDAGSALMDTVIAEFSRIAKVKQADKIAIERAVTQDEADQKARAPMLPPGTVAMWTDKAETLGREIGDLERSTKANDDERKRRDRRDERLKLVADQHALKTRLSNEIADADRTVELTEAVERLVADLEAKKKAVADATEKRDGFAKSRTTLLAEHQAAAKVYGDISSERTAAGAYAGLVSAVQAWGALLRDVGVSDEDLALYLATERTHDVPLERVRGVVDDLQAAMKVAPALPSEERVEAAQSAVQDVVKRGETTRLLLDSAGRVLEAATAAQSRADADLRVARAALVAEQQAIADRNKRRANLAEEIRGLDGERQALLNETFDVIDDDVAAELLKQKRAELVVARTRRDALNDAVQAATTLAERRTKLETLEREAGYMRTLLSAAQAARVSLMARDADPIAEVAGSIVRDVLDAELRVANGDILITSGGQTYSVDTASDGERVVVLMAFALAVRSRLPGLRIAIVDRLDALEPTLRARFAKKLLDLLDAGVVDNVLIALHGDASVAPPGYAVVKLEGP